MNNKNLILYIFYEFLLVILRAIDIGWAYKCQATGLLVELYSQSKDDFKVSRVPARGEGTKRATNLSSLLCFVFLLTLKSVCSVAKEAFGNIFQI